MTTIPNFTDPPVLTPEQEAAAAVEAEKARQARLMGCRDACGATFDPAELVGGIACPPSWDVGQFSEGRFRCGDCRRALDAVKNIAGPSGMTPDNLPPDSLGGLKELKGRVPMPVAVKGNPH
jgi:hypothetical protein